MARKTTFEVEQKYRLKNPTAMREILRGLGAKKILDDFESNELFDRDKILRSQGSVLRLRRYGKEKKGILTFKGPRLKGPYKKRIEIETPLPWKAARGLLSAAGFRVAAKYSKRREEYSLGAAHVTVDQLSGIGWFLEIEGRPSDIARIQKKLGLSRKDIEHRTYLEISQKQK